MINRHHDKFILASAIVGANVGGYLFVKDESIKQYKLPTWALGTLIGGGVGSFLGYVSPIVIPALAIGIPGYVLANYRSSLRASQQKEEKLEVPKDHE